MIARGNVPIQLLNDVKNYINITWSDVATDEKVCGLIASGSAYLDLKIGGSPDYEADGMPRTLLLEWVRYAWSEALDVFEANFLPLILTAQHEEVAANAQTDTVPAPG